MFREVSSFSRLAPTLISIKCMIVTGVCLLTWHLSGIEARFDVEARFVLKLLLSFFSNQVVP